jgi:hypothetical protein
MKKAPPKRGNARAITFNPDYSTGVKERKEENERVIKS